MDHLFTRMMKAANTVVFIDMIEPDPTKPVEQRFGVRVTVSSPSKKVKGLYTRKSVVVPPELVDDFEQAFIAVKTHRDCEVGNLLRSDDAGGRS